jgi:hypothetical protein
MTDKQCRELLPCPFCGGPAINEERKTIVRHSVTKCTTCFATAELGCWNIRVRPAPDESLVHLVPLGNSGKKAIIDIEDKERIEKHSWSLDSHGYPYRRTSEGMLYLHSVILGAIGEGLLPDHRNRNPLDNRSRNLRIVTRGENAVNSPKPSNASATSKYKGVSRDADRKKWVASICCDDKRINLGRFEKEDDAARAYNAAAYKYFGEAAFQNDVGKPDVVVGAVDASTRKDEEEGVGSTPPSPPSSCASQNAEAVDERAFSQAEEEAYYEFKHARPYNFRQFLEAYLAALSAAPSPDKVVVSLTDVAKKMTTGCLAVMSPPWRADAAKCVLDAAGIPYVD